MGKRDIERYAKDDCSRETGVARRAGRRFSAVLSCLGLLLAAVFWTGDVEAKDVASKFGEVATIVEDKCMACHSKGYDLPFYANVPGIAGIIEKDYIDGLRAMDLNVELVDNENEIIGESTVAKMEYVVRFDTMPPPKFAIVHWGSRLSDQEKQRILDWVAEMRRQHFATDPAPQFANEPLQPLPRMLPSNPAKVALGKELYNDKRLSRDNSLSCEGCHFYDKALVDNARFSTGVGNQLGDVNAPTVYNAVFNLAQFWDGRAANLAEQAAGPPVNPVEQACASWDEIVARLAEDAEFTERFSRVYPSGWSEKNITDAIAEYEKTLITPNSRFDNWLRGDTTALKQAEITGYARFKAYRCASCHVGKSVGGQSYEYVNLKEDYFADRGGEPLGSDKGRYNFTKHEDDLHRFKVPNLRNIELTAPYFHDGTVETLDDAVRLMGTYCAGINVPEGDRQLIVAFLRTLTGQFEGKRVPGKAVSR